MAKISGKLVILQISTDDGTTWKDMICLVSNDLNMTRETQTAPITKCDVEGSAQEITATSLTWEMPFDALVDTAPTSTQVTLADALTLMNNGTTVMVRQQYDNTGSDFYTVGSAIMTSLSTSAPAEGYFGYSGTFSGSGSLDITV